MYTRIWIILTIYTRQKKKRPLTNFPVVFNVKLIISKWYCRVIFQHIYIKQKATKQKLMKIIHWISFKIVNWLLVKISQIKINDTFCAYISRLNQREMFRQKHLLCSTYDRLKSIEVKIVIKLVWLSLNNFLLSGFYFMKIDWKIAWQYYFEIR